MGCEPARGVIIAELSERLKSRPLFTSRSLASAILEQLPGRPQADSRKKNSTVVTMKECAFTMSARGARRWLILDRRENYAAARGSRPIGRAWTPSATRALRASTWPLLLQSHRRGQALTTRSEMADRQCLAEGGRDIAWIEANAFDLLRDYADRRSCYDTVVLPPAGIRRSKGNRGDRRSGYIRAQPASAPRFAPAGSWSAAAVLITVSPAQYLDVCEFLAQGCPQKSFASWKTADRPRTIRPAKRPRNRVLEVHRSLCKPMK